MTSYFTTSGGVEGQFGINYLGHMSLTHSLLEKLKSSSSPTRFCRIINISSEVHQVGRIHLGGLMDKYDCIFLALSVNRHFPMWDSSLWFPKIFVSPGKSEKDFSNEKKTPRK